MNKIILGIAVVVVLIVAGYWYVVIYQPQQYAKSVVKIFNDIQKNDEPLISELNQQRLDESAKNVVMIEFQKRLYREIRKQITDLQSPLFGEMRQFHKDFLWATDKMLASIDAVELKIKVLDKGFDCQRSLNLQNLPMVENPRMRDDLRFLESFTQNIRTACREFIAEANAIAVAQTPSVADLKSKWNEVLPAIDTILNFYAKQNPDSLSSNIFELSLGPKLYRGPYDIEALPELRNFLQTLDKFLTNNRIDLTRHLNPQYSLDSEFKMVSDRVNTELQKMKEKYGE